MHHGASIRRIRMQMGCLMDSLTFNFPLSASSFSTVAPHRKDYKSPKKSKKKKKKIYFSFLFLFSAPSRFSPAGRRWTIWAIISSSSKRHMVRPFFFHSFIIIIPFGHCFIFPCEPPPVDGQFRCCCLYENLGAP